MIQVDRYLTCEQRHASLEKSLPHRELPDALVGQISTIEKI